MALDIEGIIIDTLLDLVENKGVPLERITVKQLLEASGVSRQTFYNHFLDKYDLIAKAYDRRIIGEFDVESLPEHFDFREAFLASLDVPVEQTAGFRPFSIMASKRVVTVSTGLV